MPIEPLDPEQATQVPPALLAECNELAEKLANICNEYSPTAVLFTLEAGLVNEIKNASPTLGALFEDMLQQYKRKASMLLQLTDTLIEGRDSK